MKKPRYLKTFILLCCFTAVNFLYGQQWNFVKEEGGIKIYTKTDKSSSLKAYKGEVIIHASMQKACAMVGSGRNLDWWGPDFKNIKVLAFEKNKFVQYYYIYDMPWPMTDRDLAVNAMVKTDTVTGEYSVLSLPLLNVIPENPDLVRIKKYWQKWTMMPMPDGNVRVTLEGIVDPGGNIPSWFYNLLVTEMPIRTIRSLRDRILSDKPAN